MRVRRILAALFPALLSVLLLACVAAWFLWSTAAGTRMLVESLAGRVEGLSLGEIEGTAAGEVDVSDFLLETELVRISAARVRLAPRLWPLLARRVELADVTVAALEVQIMPRQSEESAPRARVNLRWTVLVEAARVDGAKLVYADNAPIVFAALDGRVRLAGGEVALEALRVVREPFTLEGNGTVQMNPPYDYSALVRASGPAEWTAAAELRGASDGVALNGRILTPMTVPFVARVDAGERAILHVTADTPLSPLPFLGQGTNLHDLHLTADGPMDEIALVASGFVESAALPPLQVSVRGVGSTQGLDLTQVQLSGTPGDLGGSGWWKVEGNRFAFDGKADGLTFGGSRLRNLVSHLEGNDAELSLDVDTGAESVQQRPYGSAHIAYRGGWRAGSAAVAWRSDVADVDMDTSLVFAGDAVEGDVTAGVIRLSGIEWRQDDVLHFRFADDVLAVAENCWSGTPGQVCFETIEWRRPVLAAKFRSAALELPWAGADSVHGHAVVDTDSSVWSAELDARGVRPTAASALTGAIDELHLSVEGEADRYRYTGTATATDPMGDRVSIAANGSGDPVSLEVARAEVHRGDDRVVVTGRLSLDRPGGSGRIEGEVLGRPITGEAQIAGASLQELEGSARLHLRNNTVEMRAHAGAISAQLDLGGLDAFDPRLGGSVRGRLSITDAGQVIEGHLAGEELRFGEERISDFRVDLARSSSAVWDARLDVARFERSGLGYGGGGVRFTGSQHDGRVDFTWRIPEAELALSATVREDGDRIAGEVVSGALRYAEQPWSLRGTPDFSIEGRAVQIADHCWESAAASLCIANAAVNGETGQLRIDGQGIPVSFSQLPYAPEVRLDSLVELHLDASARELSGVPRYAGTLHVAMPQAKLRYFEDREMNASLVFDARVDEQKFSGELTGMRGDEPFLTGRVELPDIDRPERMKITARLTRTDLGLVTAFIPQLDQASGSFDGTFSYDTTGTATRADVHAVVGDEATVLVPLAGVTLKNLEFDANGDASRISLKLAGASGSGTVTADADITSPFSAERSIAGHVTGTGIQLLARRDMDVVGSPEIAFNYDPRGNLDVSGRLHVIDGSYRASASAAEMRETSPDVVVVRADGSSAATGRLSLDLDVAIDHFRVDMYGLNAELAGGVAVTQTTRAPRRASGTVKLTSGSFTRYGQTFGIERGRLIFAGSLTNPLVDVVSSRAIEEKERSVKVSLLLSGPADNIRSTITSSPSMSEAEALSYLVLGRPLVTATAGEGDAISSAAVALGLKQAAPITEEIKGALGLSELTLIPTGVDSATFITGKKIGSNLYVEYTYDVFSRVGGILFNYQLSERLSIETRTGEAKSMQLVYKLE